MRESSGPETILPFMYIMPPEPKTELCEKEKQTPYDIHMTAVKYEFNEKCLLLNNGN